MNRKTRALAQRYSLTVAVVCLILSAMIGLWYLRTDDLIQSGFLDDAKEFAIALVKLLCVIAGIGVVLHINTQPKK